MVDYDELFSYSTVKIVKIRDRRLGILHYLFMLTIFAYILGYQVLSSKKYLALEQPVGTIRSSLKAPNWYPNATFNSYPLCQNNSDNATCIAWDGTDVVYPPTEATAILATTRVQITYENQTCSPTIPNYCYWQNTSISPYYYIVDIESFTLMMDHTMNAVKNGIQVNARSLSGTLLDSDGHKRTSPLFGISGQSDIIPLKDILSYVETNLDSQSDTASPGAIETFRSAGIVILCLINYDNTYSFNQDNIRYETQFKKVAGTEFKAVEPVYSVPVGQRMTRNRHGIRIMFLQTGIIGKFDFQVLLLTFVSGMGLLAVATLIVDALATMVLPEKEVYSNYKFEKTVDFSDMRKGKVDPSNPVNSPQQEMA